MKDSLNVLIIDDDDVDREAVRRYLRKPGRDITFHEAANGADAERHMREMTFDCIFIDYSLPDTDGISLLRKFYNPETGLSPAPTIMLTGKGRESVMIDALRWGAQDYLVKDNISRDSLDIVLVKAKEMFALKKSQFEAAETLRQTQKMESVGQLTSGIAHDFNNLLAIVLGNTRLLYRHIQRESGIQDNARDGFEKKIEAIERAAKKGSDLVNRLMVFTRQSPLQAKITDVNVLIDEINELLPRSLGSAITVKMAPAPDLWPVRIDAGQFENAIINLAINARDAMPEGGSLTIETHNIVIDDEYVFRHPDMSSGSYVMIAVSDTGTGMSPDVVKRIFDPFYTTKPAGQGTGLGLSMVYGMLKQSGGYIHVYSEEGHGTVFRIYLPTASQDDEENTDTDAALPEQGNETILIVDDDEKVRSMGAIMLERLGYNAIQAASGRTALEILKQEHKNIKLIFTDVIMPDGMTGMELVQKAKEYYPDIKSLFTTGYTEQSIPDYDLITGRECIGKPYRKDDLSKKIREILDRKEDAA